MTRTVDMARRYRARRTGCKVRRHKAAPRRRALSPDYRSPQAGSMACSQVIKSTH